MFKLSFFSLSHQSVVVVVSWQLAVDANVGFAPFSSFYGTIIPVLFDYGASFYGARDLCSFSDASLLTVHARVKRESARRRNRRFDSVFPSVISV